MSNPAKAKGSRFEREICDYLGELFPAERIPAGASLDRGDLWTPTVDFVWQCKNRQQLSLGAWLDDTVTQQHNAERNHHWLIVKRKGSTYPGDQFAICTVSQARTIAHQLAKP
jgi:hypothetical protein